MVTLKLEMKASSDKVILKVTSCSVAKVFAMVDVTTVLAYRYIILLTILNHVMILLSTATVVVVVGAGVVVVGVGHNSSTIFSVRVMVLLESYWEPSDRISVSPQLEK